jgi:hypothetical protein
MKHLGFFVKPGADAMAAELADHRIAGLLGILLNRVTDVTEVRAGPDLHNAEPEALESDLAQPSCLHGGLADLKHAAAVAMVAVADHRHIDVDDVAVLQLPITGDAMADLVVDRGADRLRIRLVAGRSIVERRRNAALNITM